MEKFIKNIIVFGSILSLVCTSIIIINYFLIQSEPITIPANKNIVVLGDSTAEAAINDAVFKSCINISNSADSYYYSYLKLKKILVSNPKIDTILLSFAPHNIYDNMWLSDKEYININLRIYYPLMSWEDFVFLYKQNPKGVIQATSAIIKRSGKNIIFKILGIKKSYYGDFEALDRDILKEVQEKLITGEKIPSFRIPTNLNISEQEILYLHKIITISNENKLKLYLINTPKREELLQYPIYGVKEFNKYYDTKLYKTDYLDFSQFKMPDNFYSDFVHLRVEGADYFSNLLEDIGLEELSQKYNRNKVYSH